MLKKGFYFIRKSWAKFQNLWLHKLDGKYLQCINFPQSHHQLQDARRWLGNTNTVNNVRFDIQQSHHQLQGARRWLGNTNTVNNVRFNIQQSHHQLQDARRWLGNTNTVNNVCFNIQQSHHQLQDARRWLANTSTVNNVRFDIQQSHHQLLMTLLNVETHIIDSACIAKPTPCILQLMTTLINFPIYQEIKATRYNII